MRFSAVSILPLFAVAALAANQRRGCCGGRPSRENTDVASSKSHSGSRTQSNSHSESKRSESSRSSPHVPPKECRKKDLGCQEFDIYPQPLFHELCKIPCIPYESIMCAKTKECLDNVIVDISLPHHSAEVCAALGYEVQEGTPEHIRRFKHCAEKCKRYSVKENKRECVNHRKCKQNELVRDLGCPLSTISIIKCGCKKEVVLCRKPVCCGHGECTKLLTFDEINTKDGDKVLTTHEGFTFKNFAVTNIDQIAAQYGFSGYINGVVTKPNVLYNDSGSDAEILRGKPFGLVSFFLTSAWRTGLTVTITGFCDGKVVGQYKTVVNTTNSTPVFLPRTFRAVNKVVFSTCGGGLAFGDFHRTQLVIDNMTVCKPTSEA